MTTQSKNGAEIVTDGLMPIPGFELFKTHHCVTGSMLHIYHFNGHTLTEDMLLGLGSGIGFFYWHMKGQTPMLLGRGNVHRPGVDGLEIDTGRRSGVLVERHVTKSAKKAEVALLQSMEDEQPLMIHVDMGFLPYFDLPEGYHFGQHVVVVAGIDPVGKNVLLADRDGILHPVGMEDLTQARGSTFKPFPPMNTWYSYDFTDMHLPEETDIWLALTDVCESMLRGPISNLGVNGIRRAAKAVADWHHLLDEEQLRETAYNGYIFIDAEGGTGGGMFRYMYGRFLLEAAQICECSDLVELSNDLERIGDGWQEIALVFKQAATADNPSTVLENLIDPLQVIADQEQVIWEALDELSAA
jgi:hypothetical protein